MKHLQALREIIKLCKSFGLAVFDTETTGINISSDFVGISLATGDLSQDKEPIVAYFDIRDIPLEVMTPLLKDLFEDSNVLVVGHNIKYDWIQIKKLGIDIKGEYFDTLLGYWFLDPESKALGLKKLVPVLFDKEMESYNDILTKHGPKEEQINKKGKKVMRKRKAENLLEVPLEFVRQYGIDDSYWTYKLYKNWLDMQKDDMSLLYKIDLPLVRILVDMEYKGILIDEEELDNLHNELIIKAADQLRVLHGLLKEAGVNPDEFNLNSNQQLAHLFHTVLKLPVVKRTKTGPAMNEEALLKLQPFTPIAKLIIEYRETRKNLSTYVHAIKSAASSDGRVHTNFNIHRTSTGRLSSDSPNIQNIPKEGYVGKLIRKVFVAKEDHMLLRLDYSQMEVRMIANITKDKFLTADLRSGEDLHTLTAQKVFKREEVTSEERGYAKVINFGIAYGMMPSTLAKNLNIPLQDAHKYFTSYFSSYPKVRAWKWDAISNMQQTGKLYNFLGRVRPLSSIAKGANNKSLNSPVQGGAAELVKIAMLRLVPELEQLGAYIVHQIHDEVLIECPEDKAEYCLRLSKAIMESVNILPEFNWTSSCPFVVDGSIGKHWGENA